jgi:hypothetical protein
MKALAIASVVALGALLAAACNKPSEDSCKKAIENMRELLGNDTGVGTDTTSAVRACRAGSTRESVECAVSAKTVEDLEKCAFFKIPDKEEQCRKALANQRTQTGQSGDPTADDIHKCRVSMTRKTIACAIEASTVAELDKCKFMKFEEGSAGSGSAP